MQADPAIIACLLAFICVREAFAYIERDKLTSKLMSRNYHDYEFAKNVTKTMEHREQPFKEDTEIPEDLGPLNGFGAN